MNPSMPRTKPEPAPMPVNEALTTVRTLFPPCPSLEALGEQWARFTAGSPGIAPRVPASLPVDLRVSQFETFSEANKALRAMERLKLDDPQAFAMLWDVYVSVGQTERETRALALLDALGARYAHRNRRAEWKRGISDAPTWVSGKIRAALARFEVLRYGDRDATGRALDPVPPGP